MLLPWSLYQRLKHEFSTKWQKKHNIITKYFFNSNNNLANKLWLEQNIIFTFITKIVTSQPQSQPQHFFFSILYCILAIRLYQFIKFLIGSAKTSCLLFLSIMTLASSKDLVFSMLGAFLFIRITQMIWRVFTVSQANGRSFSWSTSSKLSLSMDDEVRFG